jgi:hypothetical protein
MAIFIIALAAGIIITSATIVVVAVLEPSNMNHMDH